MSEFHLLNRGLNGTVLGIGENGDQYGDDQRTTSTRFFFTVFKSSL